MAYKFYGWKSANVAPKDAVFFDFPNPRVLYDKLLKTWCAETCAPRLRERWSPENPTLGQCSITAFLVQDIFGGIVRGIARPDGNFHCYNVIGDCVFDLTSEQFGTEKLDYSDSNPEQFRDVHFKKQEKFQRYCQLRNEVCYRFFLVSNQVRVGYGRKFIDDQLTFFAFHGVPNRNSDYFTNVQISADEFLSLHKTYPKEIVMYRPEADAFRLKYVDGHRVLLEGMDRLL